MYNYLNGVSYPQFQIIDGNGVVKQTIQLPITNSKGLIENYIEKNISYEFLDYRKEKKILGYNVNFTLHFDEWTSKKTLLKIYQLLHWEYTFRLPGYENYKIILTPRVDAPSRNFDVIGTNENMSLGVMRGGVNAIGNKGIILNYTTKYLSNWGWIDPDTEDDLIMDYQQTLII